jgi:hypothetical protein
MKDIDRISSHTTDRGERTIVYVHGRLPIIIPKNAVTQGEYAAFVRSLHEEHAHYRIRY